MLTRFNPNDLLSIHYQHSQESSFSLENTIQNERDQKTVFEKHVFGLIRIIHSQFITNILKHHPFLSKIQFKKKGSKNVFEKQAFGQIRI